MGIWGTTRGAMDMTGLVALAAALGWASGLRLYLVVFLTGLAGAMGWDCASLRIACPAEPVDAGRKRFHAVRRVLCRQDSRCRCAVEHRAQRHPRPGRRGAGCRSIRSGRCHDGCGRRTVGGTLAATSLATKVATRAAINTSPEPITNVGASFFEEGLVMGGMWLAIQHPILFGLALSITLVLMIWLLVSTLRFLRAIGAQLAAFFRGEPRPVAR
jgi:hypothetical protein